MAPMVYDPENVFLKIIKGKLSYSKLFETEHALAILDAFPFVPGHALLLPKAPGSAAIMDMSPDVAASVFRELPRLANAVQERRFHLHMHVVPRFKDDGLLKVPTGLPIIANEDGSAMQAKIRGKL